VNVARMECIRWSRTHRLGPAGYLKHKMPAALRLGERLDDMMVDTWLAALCSHDCHQCRAASELSALHHIIQFGVHHMVWLETMAPQHIAWCTVWQALCSCSQQDTSIS
jgi:hypothetical protein